MINNKNNKCTILCMDMCECMHGEKRSCAHLALPNSTICVVVSLSVFIFPIDDISVSLQLLVYRVSCELSSVQSNECGKIRIYFLYFYTRM